MTHPEAPRFRIRAPVRTPSRGERLRTAIEGRLAPMTPVGRAARWALLALLAWFTVRHLGDADYQGIYGGLNLVLHEAGHLVFGWFGSPFLAAAGGTLFHALCIALVGVGFWRQRDLFAVAVTIWWGGTVFLGAAPYAADARAQLLPLVSVGDGPVSHDWHTMLEALGLLGADQLVGGALRVLGLAVLVVGLAAGVWILRSDPDRQS